MPLYKKNAYKIMFESVIKKDFRRKYLRATTNEIIKEILKGVIKMGPKGKENI